MFRVQKKTQVDLHDSLRIVEILFENASARKQKTVRWMTNVLSVINRFHSRFQIYFSSTSNKEKGSMPKPQKARDRPAKCWLMLNSEDFANYE